MKFGIVTTPTQPQHNLNWVWFDMKMGLHTTTPPPKLNFHYKEPQINPWCCLNNNINIKDNNNNKNNINKHNNNNNNDQKTKQTQNNWVVTSL